MPELPEVETVRRALETKLLGAKIIAGWQGEKKLRLPLAPHLAQSLGGFCLNHMQRRGKYLLFHLYKPEINDVQHTQQGDTQKGQTPPNQTQQGQTPLNQTIIAHLGMSGCFYINPSHFYDPSSFRPNLGLHDHFSLLWQAQDSQNQPLFWEMTYNDPRRFGFIHHVPHGDWQAFPAFQKMGVEPTADNLTLAAIYPRLKASQKSIKQFLLDQSQICGIGNIYAVESLWQAGISPKKRADKLTKPQAGRLLAAINAVLQAAINSGGSSIQSFTNSDGKPGYFQHQFQAYGRAGQPCQFEGCQGGVIIRFEQQGRSSYYCRQHQK